MTGVQSGAAATLRLSAPRILTDYTPNCEEPVIATNHPESHQTVAPSKHPDRRPAECAETGIRVIRVADSGYEATQIAHSTPLPVR